MWFTNSDTEIKDHVESWELKRIRVDDMYHFLSLENIANLGTKGKATVAEIGTSSKWQVGPAWTSREMIHWPTTRMFNRALPEEELRVQLRSGDKPYLKTNDRQDDDKVSAWLSAKLQSFRGS